MKTIVQVLAFLSCAGAVWGQSSIRFVAPNGYANVEGNSSSSDLFRTASSQFQQVYSASVFPNAPTNKITGMAFRFDGPTAQSFGGTWGISVFVATTSRDPDSLSSDYSGNANDDSILVYGGPLTIFSPASSSPRSFDIVIPFTNAFYYRPSQGNLSVYMVTASGPTNLFLDAEFLAGDSVGRVYGGITTSGTVDTLGLITRFDLTVIPEPSTWSLLLFGGLGFVFLAQRRNRKGE